MKSTTAITIAADTAFVDRLTTVRRDIHRHPETAFEEVRTSALVAAFLTNLGIEVHRGLGKTGVIGTLRGKRQGPRRIGLRADMDALFIKEATGLPHASSVEGTMHACGHDGHTTMLLGAAEKLAADPGFTGTVHFIFQPAEEGLGGAKRMLDDGFLDLFPVEAIFGMHNSPGRPAGGFIAHAGPTMASGDTCIVKIRGTGGHGAMPHRATDAVVAASSFVMALQTIVSRNVPPLEAGIVSVGAFLAGDAPNVIPGEVELRLTVRAFSAAVRDLLERRIGEIARAQAESFGCTADVDYIRRYPVLVNHPRETAFCAQVVRDWLGPEGLLDAEPVSASEDFAFFLERIPGCYVFIGNGEGEEGGCMVHNPGYDFNDRCLSTGATYWVKLVESYLKPPAT